MKTFAAIILSIVLVSCSQESRELEAFYELKRSYDTLHFECDLNGRDGECITFWKVLEGISQKNRNLILENTDRIDCNEYTFDSTKKSTEWFIKIRRSNGDILVIERK